MPCLQHSVLLYPISFSELRSKDFGLLPEGPTFGNKSSKISGGPRHRLAGLVRYVRFLQRLGRLPPVPFSTTPKNPRAYFSGTPVYGLDIVHQQKMTQSKSDGRTMRPTRRSRSACAFPRLAFPSGGRWRRSRRMRGSAARRVRPFRLLCVKGAVCAAFFGIVVPPSFVGRRPLTPPRVSAVFSRRHEGMPPYGSIIDNSMHKNASLPSF